MEILTDQALFEKVQNGQVEALGLIYERYKKILFSYFYRLTSNVEWSEDLVQTVFYRMLKYSKQFKGEGSLKSWMFSIARNTLTDGFRKNQQNKTSDLDPYMGHLAEMEQADHIIHKSEDKIILENALNLLDLETRELIVLVKLNEMKYKEVADILNMNESTIKVKVFRGIRKLQAIYSGKTKTT